MVIPSSELIKQLDEVLAPLINKLVRSKEENQQLTELRDRLLPMLMNEQITVGEAEEKVVLNMAAEPKVEYGKQKTT